MSEPTVNHSTFVIERAFTAAPARVFSALSDPAKKRRWFAEGEGFEVDSYELDFRVGGFERSRLRFKSSAPLPPGTACANDTLFMDIVADQRIVLAYTMSIAGRRISSSLATFELRAADRGTTLTFTEQAAFFEGADGPQIRQQGWIALLDSLNRELAHGG